VLFLDEQEFARQNVRRSKTPFIILTAKDETAVSNAATKDIFERVNSQRNKLVELEGADHMTISFDFDNAQQLVKNIVSYFDSLLELEEDRRFGF
jgi:alpha-beta hydrolase superfamily lysophospholipase